MKYIQLAYLTGILPIKKVKTQSALNNFDEFTMLNAKIFDKYMGFTEEEVEKLCEEYQVCFAEVKRWYQKQGSFVCFIITPTETIEKWYFWLKKRILPEYKSNQKITSKNVENYQKNEKNEKSYQFIVYNSDKKSKTQPK